MFQIVEVIPGPGFVVEPLRNKNGTLRLFNTGKAAAKFCRIVGSNTGRKLQPRRFSKTDWKQREINRFADGTYLPPPWSEMLWCKASGLFLKHYPHISTKYPGRIAFTETEAKGMADIQTPMKAGRYLQKFHANDLDPAAIAHWAALFSNRFEANVMHLAETADDIVEVYTTGPTSCMSHDADDYRSAPHHPTEAYASGDTAIAYMEREGRVTARAVVSRSKMIHGRIYGDYDRIYPLLLAAGYRDGGDWTGVKLAAVPHCGGYVMPYLDCGYMVELSDDGKFFRMVSEVDRNKRSVTFPTHDTCGMIGRYTIYSECESCGEECHQHNMYRAWHGLVCEDCYENLYSCPNCGTRLDEDDTEAVTYQIRNWPGGIVIQDWCPGCVSNYAVRTADHGLVQTRLAQFRCGGNRLFVDVESYDLCSCSVCETRRVRL